MVRRFAGRRIRVLCLAMVAVALVALVFARVATAQTLNADRLRLVAGPCVIGSVAGSPPAVVFGPCSTLTTQAATDLTLKPTGDLVLGPQGSDVMPDVGYTQNLGSLSRKYLTLHAAELWVETLVAQNTIATIGGRVLVAPTTTLTNDLAAAATSIIVKHNNLANGDRVYLEANGSVEWLAITSSASGSGPYTYTVTRNLDGSGANQWYAGDAVLNTGQTGNGYIDLFSVSGVLSGSGPAIIGNVRYGSGFNEIDPRWAIGRLNGVFNYAGNTFGFAAGTATGTNVTVDDVNGFRIRNGTTNKLVADISGNLALTGDLVLGSSSVFRSSSATGFSTGDGFYLTGGASPTLRIGAPSGNRLEYQTATGVLSLFGDGGGVTNLDGRNLQINSVDVGSLNATGFGDNVIKNGTFEGATNAIGIAGWLVASTGAAPSQNCCGTNGPGTLFFAPGNGGQANAYYRAVPAIAGQTYRVSVDTYAVTTTTAGIGLIVYESTSTSANVTYVVSSGATGTQVNATSSTSLYGAGQTGSTWVTREFTYTVPSGVRWVSLFIADATGSVSGSTYSDLHVDNIEMQRQLGAGHIQANSITANKLNVTTLSAITGNIGTLTSGSMSGITATFGSGAVTLDSGGIQITAGTGAANKIRWSDGAEMSSNGSGSLIIRPTSGGSAGLYYSSGFQNVNVSSGGVTIDPGGGSITLAGFAGGGDRHLCVNNSGGVYASATTCP